MLHVKNAIGRDAGVARRDIDLIHVVYDIKRVSRSAIRPGERLADAGALGDASKLAHEVGRKLREPKVRGRGL